jgi:hypothetical protein
MPSREIDRFKRVARIVRRERRAGNVWHRSMKGNRDAPIEAPPPEPVQLLPSPDQPRLPLRAPESPAPTVSPEPPPAPRPLEPPPGPVIRRWTLWGWWRR